MYSFCGTNHSQNQNDSVRQSDPAYFSLISCSFNMVIPVPVPPIPHIHHSAFMAMFEPNAGVTTRPTINQWGKWRSSKHCLEGKCLQSFLGHRKEVKILYLTGAILSVIVCIHAILLRVKRYKLVKQVNSVLPHWKYQTY